MLSHVALSDQSVSYAAVAFNPLAFPDLVVSKWYGEPRSLSLCCSPPPLFFVLVGNRIPLLFVSKHLLFKKRPKGSAD